MTVENLYVNEDYWANGYTIGDGWIYPAAEIQKASPSAIIELYELAINVEQHGIAVTYRFHAGSNLNANGELIWAGNSYMRFPVEVEGFKYEGRGSLPRPTLRIANLTGTITALLLTLPRGLEGAKFTRIRTLARYLDAANFPGSINPFGTPDPTAEFPREVFYVDRKATENRDVIEFELAAAFDLANVRAPKRQCLSNICQWKYRSAECSYNGTAYFDANGNVVNNPDQDVCGKTVDDCNLRFQQVSRLGTVTAGSNILTLDAAAGVSSGDPVRGFGVATGTTVVSYTGAAVTMSANAIATTGPVTRTGTLQTNRTQIIMTSVTGLAVGMVINGPKIPAGTTIAGISGTTITLGQPVKWADVLTPVTTKLTLVYLFGIPYSNYPTYGSTGYFDPTGVAPGQYFAGPGVDIELGIYVVQLVGGGGSYRAARLSQYPGDFPEATYTFYAPQAQTLQTYSFSAPDSTYTFRADTSLPFGSFPGIGTYFT
jgi:lambda family phage minor tail protein L